MHKNGLILLVIIVLASACRKDDLPGAVFVDDISLHLVYDQYGSDKKFPQPLQVTMNNNTEQVQSVFASDDWGRVQLTGLLPGAYTMIVSGRLSDEIALSGFTSGLALRAGKKQEINQPQLFEALVSPLIFKEIYYAGSPTPTGGTYRNDNFYSIYNNSDSPQDISTLYIGMCENYGALGETGPLWPGEEPGNYSNVYVMSMWKITSGDAPVMIDPGQTIVIATMAAPHNANASYNLSSPVDLSNADYEAYIPDPENTYPDFDAPNMELAFWPAYGFLWRMGVFGQGMVLVQATREQFAQFETVTLPETFQDPFEGEEYWLCLKVPNSFVCDAVDIIQNETVTNTKRFSPVLDAGYATVGDTYNGKSIARRPLYEGSDRLQDTNNSLIDFYVNDNPSAR